MFVFRLLSDLRPITNQLRHADAVVINQFSAGFPLIKQCRRYYESDYEIKSSRSADKLLSLLDHAPKR
jgi:hypothetical protein